MATKKRNTQAAAAGTPTIEDIPHEVVKQTFTPDNGPTVRMQGQEITIDDQIMREIAKFGIADAGIAELKKQFGGLVITGPKDKDGYESVKKAWNLVRSKRTGLEKKGLELRGGYGTITKAIKGEEDRLIALITPLENDLQTKWKAVDDEKEAEKKRKIEEEEQQLQKRLEELMSYGVTLRDGMYRLGDTISLDVASIRAMPEDQYKKLVEVCKRAAAEIAEQKRLQKEREDKERKDMEDQQNKLREDQELLRKEQETMRRQREELESQRKEAARLRRELRGSKLIQIGFTEDGRGGFKFQTPIRETPIAVDAELELPDPEFEVFLKNMMVVVKDEQEKADEQERLFKQKSKELEERKVLIHERMMEAGYQFHPNGYFVYSTQDKYTNTVKVEELLRLTTQQELDQAIQAAGKERKILDDAYQIRQDKLKQAQKLDEENKEKERRASLSDGDMLHEMITGAQLRVEDAIRPTQLKTKAGQKVAKQLLDGINQLMNVELKKLESLKASV